MHLVQAKVDEGSLENWRKRIAVTPVLKSFRVRPIDVDFDGTNCIVTVINRKESKAFSWDLLNTEQLIEQLAEIGIAVNRIESTNNEYGIDLSFAYKINI